MTNKCSECEGTGEVFETYSDEKGGYSKHFYQCAKCGGTGEINRPFPIAVTNEPMDDIDYEI